MNIINADLLEIFFPFAYTIDETRENELSNIVIIRAVGTMTWALRGHWTFT